jgi:hypothetical protein
LLRGILLDLIERVLYRPIENERENVYSKFLPMKGSKKCLSFSSACYLICMLPAHDITKEFWKNRHFKHMAASFPLRCQQTDRILISGTYYIEALLGLQGGSKVENNEKYIQKTYHYIRQICVNTEYTKQDTFFF